MESRHVNNNFESPKNYDLSGRKRTSLSSEASKIKDISQSLLLNTSYRPTNYFQSTPKTKSLDASPVPLMNGSVARSSPSGRRSFSPVQRISTSPTKLADGSISPRQISDVDTDTIQKQRRELQLLIAELKDRDRELNDMVQTHQKQIHAWDEDRQRILALERRCARLEGELKSRNGQCKALTARLKSNEAEEMSKTKELESTLFRLKELTEHANGTTQQVEELQEKNGNLSDSLRQLSNNFGQLQAKEQELLTKIQLKENDITEANIHIGEFQQKTRRLDSALQEYQTLEKALRVERDQFRDQLNATKNEVQTLRGEMSKQFSDTDDLQSDLAQSKQEVLVLQKEVFLAGEREKRKDQLLELQKSKQERTDIELQNLRQICERQQRDISYMQMHLQSTQDAFLKAETQAGNERDFESSQVNNTAPEWLRDVAVESTGTSNNGSMGALSRPLDTSPRVGGLLSAHITPGGGGGNVVEDFTGLSLGDMREYSFNGPGSHLSDPTPLSSSMKHKQNSLGRETFLDQVDVESSLFTNDSEPFFQLPSSASGATFPTTEQPDTIPYMTQHPEEEGSPTNRLHRLLAESRYMVQNLEQSTTNNTPATGFAQGSPKLFSSSLQNSGNPNLDRPRSS